MRFPVRFALSLSVAVVALAAHADEAHLMRHADVFGEDVVFTYEDDLWLVSFQGGEAHRITRHPGVERYAKFSPDGRWLAFTAEYDGGVDVYVMEARGGEPRRLTYHPADDKVLDWTPDGQGILFRSRRVYPFRAEQLYTVPFTGGMPTMLPVDRAGLAALSPDGTQIVYNRTTREDRTWKRYRGGTAQDLWLGSLADRQYRKVTDWEGTDNYPMWHMDRIYFSSDREHDTLNLYELDPASGAVRALTAYTDYDVKYPSLGPGRIVYQHAERLHLLTLSSGESQPLSVTLPTDGVQRRAAWVDLGDHVRSFGLSPTGTRLLIEDRGELIDLPVDEGQPRVLTRSSASREKDPAWSPDGRWIAFLSDRTGEEELYLLDASAPDAWTQLTRGGLGYRFRPTWSPDSRHLLFGDKFMRLTMVAVDGGATTVIDQGEFDDGWERWGIQDFVWSPCGRWVAYSKMEPNMHESVFLHSLDTGATTRVTGRMTDDWSPSFDPEGRYLYLLSKRSLRPTMGAIDHNHFFLDVTLPYVVVLRDGEPSPYAPVDDPAPGVEAAADDDEPAAPERKGRGRKDADVGAAATATVIDLEGIERRIVVADGVEAGNYFRLQATADGFVVLRRAQPQFLKYQNVVDETVGGLTLLGYDLAEAELTVLMEEVGNVHLSADGAKLVYRAGDRFGVVDTGTEATVGDGRVALDGVRLRVERVEEFTQIFDEAWRVQRDWFYDPSMHRVDWAATRDKYRGLVAHCGNRGDLNYLIGEMIGELNVGHAYVWGGDRPHGGTRVPVGLLGVDFDTPAGAPFHRIAHIVPGTPWDPAERSPLAEPGSPVRAGDYLIAVDGVEVPASDNVYRHLQDRAGALVVLTVNDTPSRDGARSHRVRTLADERAIRYREWVETNRALVEQRSHGALGYVHIPSMGQSGLIEFARGYYGQVGKQGMVVDVRYNGGGFVADMILDRLERRIWSLTQPREGRSSRNPERVHVGPLAVVINEHSGSNAEFFAEAVKRKGLGLVIGTRTWGGSIGIEPHQDLVDGGLTTPAQFGLFGLDRSWLIEGRGVEPQLPVQNMPGDVLAGIDSQLITAIDVLLQQVASTPPTVADPPAYPDKAK